jgi:hypothetical protein
MGEVRRPSAFLTDDAVNSLLASLRIDATALPRVNRHDRYPPTDGAPRRPLLIALAAGISVQLLAFTAEIIAIMTNPPGETIDSEYLLRLAGTGAVGLALASAVAVRVCARQCGKRDLAGRTTRWTSVAAGALTGALPLSTGLVIAPRWLTLPVYLIGVALGTTVGIRWTRRSWVDSGPA